MVFSAENHEKSFLHTMGLTRYGSDGPGEIYKTLKRNGITDALGIFTLSKSEIKELKYKENKETFRIKIGEKNMLCVLSAYNTIYIRAGIPLTIIYWLKVTQ